MALARPMPEAAPVTRATRPSNVRTIATSWPAPRPADAEDTHADLDRMLEQAWPAEVRMLMSALALPVTPSKRELVAAGGGPRGWIAAEVAPFPPLGPGP